MRKKKDSSNFIPGSLVGTLGAVTGGASAPSN